MTVLQGILLGILQGIAEFLPISSSGHLKVAQSLFGLDDVPLLFDVFLHLATLLAVVIFFRKKIWELLKTFFRWISKKPRTEPENFEDNLTGTENASRKTIVAVILTTIVTGILGLFSSKIIPDLSVKFVCAGFIVTAILLIVSSILEKKQSQKNIENKSEPKGISVKQSLFIGLLQGIGTLPGISRSGSTIAGALFAGVDRKSAGEFSFIVSIPAIFGAFLLELKDLGEVSQSIGFFPVFAGCVAAFVVGYFSLSVLMKLIKNGKLQWFAAYLIPAGILGMIFLK